MLPLPPPLSARSPPSPLTTSLNPLPPPPPPLYTGKTSVLVAVYGPMQVRAREEKINQATIEVVVSPEHGQTGPLETLYGSMLRQTVEAVVLKQLHPRTKVQVVVQVIRDDGSVLAAALNGISMALVDAGIPCNSMLAATTAGISPSGEVLLDINRHEEAMCDASVTLGFSSGSSGIVLSHMSGRMRDKHYSKLVSAGREASKHVLSYIKLFFEKQLQQ
jgi:exosome complex component RRP46